MFSEKYLYEEWRPINGYEGLYEVSNFGRVAACERFETIPNPRNPKYILKRKRKRKILSLELSKNGYLILHLYKNGKGKRCLVHRLVAEAFIPNPLNLPQVNHRDEDKTNNFVYVNSDGSFDPEKSNLEWCSASYNSSYGTKNTRHREKMLNNEKRSIPVIQKTLEGEFVKYYPSLSEAKREGYRIASITNVCKGNLKQHMGYLWEYAANS